MKIELNEAPRVDNTHKVNLCAIVITYYPTPSQIDNLFALLSLFDHLIVVDNTPDDENVVALNQFTGHNQVQVIFNRANLGIAAALNIGVQLATKQGYQWVVTLDQDSKPERKLTDFFRAVLQSKLLLQKIGVVGANYINTNNGRLGVAVANAEQEIMQVRSVITSGSLLNLQCYEEIEGFEENLFIDMVDTEYCFRARKHGYTIWVSTLPLMEHAVGHAQSIIVFGKKIMITTHPPIRNYYIFRNTIFTVREYLWFDFLGCMDLLMIYLPKVLIRSVLLGEKKTENLRMILKGIRDGASIFHKNVNKE